uniref:Uncharacterized protein n=1 Tax=Entomoneis paludosa TaxID=265537 RepID=A0A7S2YFG9_9STRA|mmetsp:Transcript_30660/g.64045  ORF Transcript_30660/g.64045 Transcript_30660/m.64045 type:complete len:183 (+) Transcript_30660:270-818(+)|eukprot:CAMPEP_0172462668 /NCGR_PEP_ID=MMETSP1065-20121228/44515_1 /TAXON_ID=265537 /ORGANISM="Amphiprora paludosa, Strain CCMP125" /LENGTH=182 /DNA_ID=CAMNT_0013218389 /DNA_START=185 /DNA_END=733 /DNA_ORIENTATION=+
MAAAFSPIENTQIEICMEPESTAGGSYSVLVHGDDASQVESVIAVNTRPQFASSAYDGSNRKEQSSQNRRADALRCKSPIPDQRRPGRRRGRSRRSSPEQGDIQPSRSTASDTGSVCSSASGRVVRTRRAAPPSMVLATSSSKSRQPTTGTQKPNLVSSRIRRSKVLPTAAVSRSQKKGHIL